MHTTIALNKLPVAFSPENIARGRLFLYVQQHETCTCEHMDFIGTGHPWFHSCIFQTHILQSTYTHILQSTHTHLAVHIHTYLAVYTTYLAVYIHTYLAVYIHISCSLHTHILQSTYTYLAVYTHTHILQSTYTYLAVYIHLLSQAPLPCAVQSHGAHMKLDVWNRS